jgi:hypothetical protein
MPYVEELAGLKVQHLCCALFWEDTRFSEGHEAVPRNINTAINASAFAMFSCVLQTLHHMVLL